MFTNLILWLLISTTVVHASHPTIGQNCKTTKDCLGDGWEYCGSEGKCMHKDVGPMKIREFWGMLMVVTILMITNIGGVGGGGTVVPVAMIFLRFDAKNAIPLSNISIFFSSLIRWILNSRLPHPLKDGKGIVVDMNLGILMLPLIVSGVSIGVIFNIILPDILIISAYLSGLLFFGRGVTMKTFELYKMEVARDEAEALKKQREKEEEQSRKEGLGESEMAILPKPDKKTNKGQVGTDPDALYNTIKDLQKFDSTPSASPEQQEKLTKIIEAESTNFQWVKVGLNWGLIAILLVISLLKGATNKKDSITGLLRCEPVDWVLFLVLQIICITFLIAGVIVLKKDFAAKKEAGYEFVEGDLQATTKDLVVMVSASFFGAVFAAFSGLGPGMVFGPALIMAGIESRVATATGMYLTMFTTLVATIQLIIMKQINPEYAFYVVLMTIIGTFLGLFLQSWIVTTYGRVSYSNFFMVASIIFAFTSVIALNIPTIIHKSELGQGLFIIKDYCEIKK